MNLFITVLQWIALWIFVLNVCTVTDAAIYLSSQMLEMLLTELMEEYRK